MHSAKSSADPKWFWAAGAFLLLVGSVAYIWSHFAGASPADAANVRTYICAETGKSFTHRLVIGETEPILSPFTNRNTGWRAEACYWTKDGRARKKPTWVLVKQRMGQQGQTFCPDCGREVTPHNALPPKKLMDAAE